MFYRRYRNNRYRSYGRNFDFPRRSFVRKEYKRYYKHAGPDVFGIFFVIVSGLIVGLVSLIIRLFQKIFQPKSIIKEGVFTIKSNIQDPSEPVRDYNKEFKDFNTKIQTLRQDNLENENKIDGRYGLKDSLLTESEKKFLEVLKQVVGDQYSISCQVPLSGIVTVLDSNKYFTNYRDFNQIKAKTIDFVLYDKEFKPYLCIELDGNSHMLLNRIKRDMFINDVMSSVGLKILHIYPAREYDLDELRSKILN